MSTGSRQPEQAINFVLDPIGQRVGSFVHWGDKLALIDDDAVKRRYKEEMEQVG